MKHKHEDVDELDDSDNDDGYNLRPKRIRIESSSPYINKRAYRKKNLLSQLPNEIIQKIFKYITYEELGTTIRFVDRRFRILAEDLMNSAFKNIEKKLVQLKGLIAQSISHSQDDMEIRCMCKLLNTTEYLLFHYTIIQSTIWRYIYNKDSSLCMYAGEILDSYYDILHLYTKEPSRIYTPSILNDYTHPKEATNISQLTKTFVLFFDRVSELSMNTTVFWTGSKILDILDCATEAQKQIREQTIADDTLIYKVSYHFSHSWLVALETNDEKAKPWNEQMRLMYMRLRRIVISHTEMHMEYSQYSRELNLRPDPLSRLKKPVNSVYTGYGEVGNMFYYYGAMNEGAYLNKFDFASENIYEDESDEDVMNRDDRIPFAGLEITIELSCPLNLAPMSVLKSIDWSLENLNGLPKKEMFDLKIDFEFPGAIYPRLPTNYSVHITGQR